MIVVVLPLLSQSLFQWSGYPLDSRALYIVIYMVVVVLTLLSQSLYDEARSPCQGNDREVMTYDGDDGAELNIGGYITPDGSG